MNRKELIRLIEGAGGVLIRSGKHLIYRIGRDTIAISHGSGSASVGVVRQVMKLINKNKELTV